ncbi:hypothetical protein LEP1GSC088_0104 [Leptospira interrogans str. L1207]|nr:hypothetical protein LEP1GSC088_0104 [Leptospira interrogans str. L1207]
MFPICNLLTRAGKPVLGQLDWLRFFTPNSRCFLNDDFMRNLKNMVLKNPNLQMIF